MHRSSARHSAAPRLVPFALLLALAPANALAAWPHDPHQAIQVVYSFGTQHVDAALPDGSGGAIVVVEDSRNGNLDLFAQHVLADGTLDPAWGSGGVPVCTAAGDQVAARAVSDGAGGAYLCWLDHRGAVAKVYGTELLGNGTLAPALPANGLLLDTVGANADDAPQMCLDTQGGAVVVYEYEATAADHDIYGARFTGAGLFWSATLRVAPTPQTAPVVASEGGVFDLAYVESGATIYVGRFVISSGAVFTTPFAISNAAYVNTSPRIASCDDGGAIVTWSAQSGASYAPWGARFFGGVIYGFNSALAPFAPGTLSLGDEIDGGNYSDWLLWVGGTPQTLYAQELTRNGPSTAVPIASKADAVSALPVAAPDGTGGVIAGFGDANGFETANAKRVMQGVAGVPALWNTPSGEGVVASVGIVSRTAGAVVSDGGGGALLFSNDLGIFPPRVYAMHIDRWGAYGGEPSGLTVKDVANDQGGSVRVTWGASYLDVALNSQVQTYWLWRQVPTAAAMARLARGAALERAGATAPPAPGTLRLVKDGAQAIAWEFVGSQVANGFGLYSMTAATAGDSTAGGNPLTWFMVEARDYSYGVGWTSAAASGYSVDNLPPATPAPFAGTYAGGTTSMTWGVVTASDLAGYRLYRGTSTAFAPGAGNLIATTGVTTAAYTDVAGGPYVYKLTAIDVHGNESAPATLVPGGALAVGESAPTTLEFALAGANPSRAGATLRFALPAAGAVRLAIHDVTGRRVRVLADARYDAGRYSVRWDGTEEGGSRVADGVYFARFEAGGRRMTARVAMLR